MDFLAKGGAGRVSSDDLVQEVYRRAWEQRERFRGESSRRTYLFAIATNVLNEDLRRRAKSEIALPNDVLDDARSPGRPSNADAAGSGEVATLIEQAISKLPKAQREAFELDQNDDLSRSDAVRQAGCNPNQFAARVHRARIRLRRLLRDVQ